MTVYIKLLHGRDNPGQDMQDWGFVGPLLGPFEAIHFTYRDHIRCINNSATEDEIELGFTDDMLTYQGKYYGDFKIAAEFGGDTQKKLPPDAENLNADRAEWAAAALRHFQSTTGTDSAAALADLLDDLMHWCDRNGASFDDELSRARMHYEAETTPEDTTTEAAAADPPAAVPSEIESEPAGPVTAKTYRAEFFTPADYAFRNFDADTPEHALQLARQFYDEDGDLDFRSYENNAGIDEIQIWDTQRGTLAKWESDDYRLRNTARELLTALQAQTEAAKSVIANWDKRDLAAAVRALRASIPTATDAIAKVENRRT
jgi:hypothetical protein